MAGNRDGRACLLVRMLSESDLRFVAVSLDGWDHHGDILGESPRLLQQTDQPVTQLLNESKRGGLLDDTRLFRPGELGRTPLNQNFNVTSPVTRTTTNISRNVIGRGWLAAK